MNLVLWILIFSFPHDNDSVDIMVAGQVFTSTCKLDENRIFREARRNPNELANNPRRLVGSRR
jgi:hypothetical protein